MYASEVNFRLPQKALDLIKVITDKWYANDEYVEPLYRSDFAEIGKMLRTGTYVENPYCDEETFNNIKAQHSTLSDQAVVNAVPVPAHLQQIITKLLPKDLQKSNPQMVIQLVTGGTHVQAHWDHNKRASSLFCLLEADGADTIWYEPVGEYEIPEKFRIVYDLSKFNEVFRIAFQEHKWYVFNHAVCHGVYRHNLDKRRTALVIEFNDLTAEQLYNSFVV